MASNHSYKNKLGVQQPIVIIIIIIIIKSANKFDAELCQMTFYNLELQLEHFLFLARFLFQVIMHIQTSKLSILLRFYFHDVVGQLKTNFHTNFRFKRVLGFVVEYA